jgi:pimeloyl-ACP methyl ester carboxylesterase
VIHHAIDGTGKPLVYLLPAFAHVGLARFRAIPGHMTIAIEHRDPSSIEQWASDVVVRLRELGVARADFLGQSFGGAVATMIALRHPELADRIATYGATFGPPSEAHDARMLHFDAPPTPDDRAFAYFRERHPSWQKTWDAFARFEWNGFSKEELRSLTTPVLLVVGDRDFVRVEHVVEASRLLPNAELAVIPDAGHFALFSEPERVIPIVTHFFDKPAKRSPVATAAMGYHPGETR